MHMINGSGHLATTIPEPGPDVSEDDRRVYQLLIQRLAQLDKKLDRHEEARKELQQHYDEGMEKLRKEMSPELNLIRNAKLIARVTAWLILFVGGALMWGFDLVDRVKRVFGL